MNFNQDDDIDVYSLCESVYYSCNNDEYDYVLECVNDWIQNRYNDNILLEDIYKDYSTLLFTHPNRVNNSDKSIDLLVSTAIPRDLKDNKQFKNLVLSDLRSDNPKIFTSAARLLKKVAHFNFHNSERASYEAENLVLDHLRKDINKYITKNKDLFSQMPKSRRDSIEKSAKGNSLKNSLVERHRQSILSRQNVTTSDLERRKIKFNFNKDLIRELSKIKPIHSNYKSAQELIAKIKNDPNYLPSPTTRNLGKLLTIPAQKVFHNYYLQLGQTPKLIYNAPQNKFIDVDQQTRSEFDSIPVDNELELYPRDTATEALARRRLGHIESMKKSQPPPLQPTTAATPQPEKKVETKQDAPTPSGQPTKPETPPLQPATAATPKPERKVEKQQDTPPVQPTKPVTKESPRVVAPQSRLSRTTTWMKNNKVKGGLGVVAAGAAIGGSIYAYKRFKNKPRSIIAKRIQALRGVYHKFMINAQRNPKKANVFKRIAAKILSVIDKLLHYLQNKADGR